MKRIFLYCISTICIFLFINCTHRNNQEFTIYYFCGDIEPYCRIECADLKKYCMNKEYDDTLYTDLAKMEEIKKAIMNAKPVKVQNPTLSALMYVQIGNYELCLNGRDNQCWIRQGDGEFRTYILNNKAIYLLKCISKYYNYFDTLEDDKEIQLYGIPSDYEKEQVEENVKVKETSKILVRLK